MDELPRNIEKELLALPKEQRTYLTLKLLDSIEGHVATQAPECVEKAWIEETNRRYEAYLSDDEEAIPAAQVFAELSV